MTATSATIAALSYEHARCHDLYMAHLPCFLCSRGRLCGIGRPLHDDDLDAGKAWAWAMRQRAGRAR